MDEDKVGLDRDKFSLYMSDTGLTRSILRDLFIIWLAEMSRQASPITVNDVTGEMVRGAELGPLTLLHGLKYG